MVNDLFLGSSVTPLVCVEVKALDEGVDLCAALIKTLLLEHHGILAIQEQRWRSLGRLSAITLTGSLPSQDPLQSLAVPCQLEVYGIPIEHDEESSSYKPKVMVVESTLVRVIATQDNGLLRNHLSATPKDLLDNHDKSTVEALKLRMSLLLEMPILIGTTESALAEYELNARRKRVIQQRIMAYSNKKLEPQQNHVVRTNQSFINHDGALIVHSPHHGAGKTLLVQHIAKKMLGCEVHILSTPPLLATYGIYADAALETILHGIIVGAALRSKSVCIILDHLQGFGPLGKTPLADATLPIYASIKAHLNTLVTSIRKKLQVPFPGKNPLYNSAQTGGITVQASVCIVGILTCGDDDNHTLLNLMDNAGRYRLPDLTTEVRVRALTKALSSRLALSPETCTHLPSLATSHVGLRGRDFRRIARMLASTESPSTISVAALTEAMHAVQPKTAVPYEVVMNAPNDSSPTTDDFFAAVGGNAQAKIALQDALALDPNKRRLLQSIGMSPPSGVLLYGPPGTGKTLLAKVVAKILNLQSMGNNGAFFSIQASDIVRSQVGNSEKELVSVFTTARANAPSVVFIDEFQAIFTERNSGGGSQLASTLLQCMDDIQQWQDSDVVAGDESQRIVVMGATNTPWMVDKAFLRAGRFDKVVHVGLPTLKERISVLLVHIRKMRLDESVEIDNITTALAEKTPGFSGADLAALCRAAGIRCLEDQGGDGRVNMQHFFEAVETDVEASTAPDLVAKLSRWKP